MTGLVKQVCHNCKKPFPEQPIQLECFREDGQIQVGDFCTFCSMIELVKVPGIFKRAKPSDSEP